MFLVSDFNDPMSKNLFSLRLIKKGIMNSFYHGKVILTGEHSVVFGHQAVLASLSRGITATVQAGQLDQDQENDRYLQHLIGIFKKLSGRNELNFTLKINSDLPTQSGLGSSAAFAAAVLSALAEFYQYPLDQEQLYQLVWQAENFIHGRSSGADPSIVVRGGLQVFQNGQARQIISPSLAEETFFLIDSGSAVESTGEMLAKVASLPNHLEVVAQIGMLSEKIISDLEQDSFDPEVFKQNQELLEELGVVGEQAKNLIKKLQEFGSAAKITGAGGFKQGSGYILAWHHDQEAFASFLKQENLSFFTTKFLVQPYAKN